MYIGFGTILLIVLVVLAFKLRGPSHRHASPFARRAEKRKL